MPDVNKCSYIHGYFQLLRAHRQQKDAGPLSLNDHRRMLIGGHTAEGSRFCQRVYRVLQKQEKLSVRDYYQMGKATHYLADRFTYPHTMRYTSGFLRISDTKSSCIFICGICLQSCRICGMR